jgi:hypothetical protein
MVLLMGSVLLSTSLQADEPRASSAVVQPIKIACVGDSITLGVGIPSPETNDEADRPAITLTAGQAHTFQLEPFQVLVMERK